MPNQSTGFLPVSAVAATLGLHPLTVARYCREGRFASACRAEDGKRWLIAEAEVLDLLKSHQKREVRHG